MGFVLAASLAFGFGGAFLKASDGFSRLWPSLVVAALFVLGAMLLALAVRVESLSTAYTLGLGIEAVVSIGLGIALFHERLTPTQTIGIVLILAGVVSVRFG